MAVDKPLIVLISLLAARPSSDSYNHGWNYANPNWGIDYPTCRGALQSPINLDGYNSIGQAIPQINLRNYGLLFARTLVLENNGHTVFIKIPETVRGTRPTISGGLLQGVYEAQAVHFHWGSPRGVKGSEHAINGQRFDVEMHILHKNMKYATLEEARQRQDGVTVLAIMLNMVGIPLTLYPGLNKVFNKLPKVVAPGANAAIDNQLTLGHFLGDVDTKNFFAYRGSVTTPPCLQVVTWHIFPNPLYISRALLYKFFQLKQEDGTPLVNNFRPLQPVNGRPVFRRKGL